MLTESEFRELIDQAKDLLYNYARARVRNTEEIEDLIQEALMAAYESRNQFRGDSQPTTWLIGILKFKILDHYRRTYRNARVISETDIINDLFDGTGHWLMNQADSRPNAAVQLEKAEIWEMLQECIHSLPENYRIVYQMRELDNLETEIICKELNITTTNLHVTLHRARLHLKRCLNARGIYEL
ncbi:MAG: sigma-70 family RNA polymerase sigma factor [Leptospiraceae bacterium]|nr:sigma-70 family RNA polymerase sigma factor [Leptospiraceae bacterium]MCB1201562.1 sigma-70 family RNA polymerase sigma factor [Leptospiraceae bacterium]